MSDKANDSIRLLNTIGLFIFGGVFGVAMVVVGLGAVGAGHGTDFFYLLASSPGFYLLDYFPDVLRKPLFPAVFWPIIFAALPWAQKKVVFYGVAVSLLLHFSGVVYGLFQNSVLDGLEHLFDAMPGMFLCVSLFYIGTHAVIIFSLWRAYKKMKTSG